MEKKFGRPELIVVEYWMFKLKKVTSFCGTILPGKFDPNVKLGPQKLLFYGHVSIYTPRVYIDIGQIFIQYM